MSDKQLKDRVINLIGLELALEDMGIYPQSCNGIPRTEKQDGWNAAIMSVTTKWSKINKWIKDIPPEHKDFVQELILKDEINLSVDGDNIAMQINTSDLFGWGYSNFDDIQFDELSELKKAFEDSPKFGGILWACRKLKQCPQGAYYKYFSKEEKKIFDACGP